MKGVSERRCEERKESVKERRERARMGEGQSMAVYG